MIRPLLLVVFSVSSVIGCGAPDPDASRDLEGRGSEASGAGRETDGVDGGLAETGDRAVTTYTTGERDVVWPDYDFPLVHQFDLPPVPPSLQVPASRGGRENSGP